MRKPSLPKVPFGYKIIEEPWRRDFFARMAEHDAAGNSIRDIVDLLEDEFKFPVSFSIVQRTLRNYHEIASAIAPSVIAKIRG